jgi:hypothetical protein
LRTAHRSNRRSRRFLLDRKGVIRKVIVGEEIISGGWGDGLKGDLEKVLAEK